MTYGGLPSAWKPPNKEAKPANNTKYSNRYKIPKLRSENLS